MTGKTSDSPDHDLLAESKPWWKTSESPPYDSEMESTPRMLAESKPWCKAMRAMRARVEFLNIIPNTAAEAFKQGASQEEWDLLKTKKLEAINDLDNVCQTVFDTGRVETLDLVLMCGGLTALEKVKATFLDESSPFLGPALATLTNYKEALAYFKKREPQVDAYRINKHTIYVQELPLNSGGHGWKVWHASYLLALLLTKPPYVHRIAGKRILELGSGCGLPGLAAAHCGAAEVTLTDRRGPILANLECNCELQNWKTLPEDYRCKMCEAQGLPISRPKVKWLDWNQEAALVSDQGAVALRRNSLGRMKLNANEVFDVIIAADCLYTSEHAQVLGKVVRARLAPKGTFIMLHPLREKTYLPEFQECIKGLGLRMKVTPAKEALEEGGLSVEQLDVTEEYAGGVVLLEGGFANEPEELDVEEMLQKTDSYSSSASGASAGASPARQYSSSEDSVTAGDILEDIIKEGAEVDYADQENKEGIFDHEGSTRGGFTFSIKDAGNSNMFVDDNGERQAFIDGLDKDMFSPVDAFLPMNQKKQKRLSDIVAARSSKSRRASDESWQSSQGSHSEGWNEAIIAGLAVGLSLVLGLGWSRISEGLRPKNNRYPNRRF